MVAQDKVTCSKVETCSKSQHVICSYNFVVWDYFLHFFFYLILKHIFRISLTELERELWRFSSPTAVLKVGGHV